MANRLDAMVVREKYGKSYWTKVGAAFEGSGGKWIVRLDATPLDGVIHLMPRRARRQEEVSQDPADAEEVSQDPADAEQPWRDQF